MTKELKKRALRLEYFTVGYNVLECIFSVLAGIWAGSVALVGFGLDSAIESISGCVLIWRLRKDWRGSDEEERAEKRAARLVGWSFFILGAYVLYESLEKLYLREPAGPSLPGIAIAVLSLITMPILAWLKYSVAIKLGSRALAADSKETFVCSLLSAALLAGLLLNYLYGIWWADPAAALVIVVFLFIEGRELLAEERCGCG